MDKKGRTSSSQSGENLEQIFDEERNKLNRAEAAQNGSRIFSLSQRSSSQQDSESEIEALERKVKALQLQEQEYIYVIDSMRLTWESQGGDVQEFWQFVYDSPEQMRDQSVNSKPMMPKRESKREKKQDQSSHIEQVKNYPEPNSKFSLGKRVHKTENERISKEEIESNPKRQQLNPQKKE